MKTSITQKLNSWQEGMMEKGCQCSQPLAQMFQEGHAKFHTFFNISSTISSESNFYHK
jgi:hypothetical protein